MNFTNYIILVLTVLLFSSCNQTNEIITRAKNKLETVKDKLFGEVIDDEIISDEKTQKKKFSGLREAKYPDGKLKSACMYKNGIREGSCKSYYENGSLYIESEYTNGEKNGLFKWFYKNGQVYQETTYKMGKKHGTDKLFWENGKLKSEMSYYEDKPVMDLKEYSSTGKLITNYPEIEIKEKNTVYFNSEYKLIIKVNNYKGKVKNVEAFVGELAKENYLDHVGLNWISRDSDGNFSYSMYVPHGSAIYKKVNVFVKVITPYGNPLILKKDFNVAVSND